MAIPAGDVGVVKKLYPEKAMIKVEFPAWGLVSSPMRIPNALLDGVEATLFLKPRSGLAGTEGQDGG